MKFSVHFVLLPVLLCAVSLLVSCGTNNGNPDSIGSDTVPEAVTDRPALPETEFPTVPATEPETVPVTEPPVTEPPVTEPPVTEPPVTDGTVSSKGYKITVENGVTYVGGILIANKTYALPETYAPGSLIPECYQAFLKMVQAARSEGLNIFIRSDYRSYYDQRYIYAGYVEKDGVAAADRYSARAGHSEHQTGLAMDLNSFEYSFGETPEGLWLAAHGHEYGFIIRYPQDKEAITGYRYEPWHVRYLGVETAAAVFESGLCLEEYLGITSVYPSED